MSSRAAAADPAGGVHVLPAPRGRLTLGTRLLGLAVVAVAMALALWWLVAAAAAILHIVELVAMGAVTGWVGWKLGVRHGRHGH
jgi:hypothetical protein